MFVNLSEPQFFACRLLKSKSITPTMRQSRRGQTLYSTLSTGLIMGVCAPEFHQNTMLTLNVAFLDEHFLTWR